MVEGTVDVVVEDNGASNAEVRPVVNDMGYSESDWEDALASLGDIEGTEKKRITPDKDIKESVGDVNVTSDGVVAKNSVDEKNDSAPGAVEGDSAEDNDGDNSEFINEILNSLDGNIGDVDSNADDTAVKLGDEDTKSVAEAKPFVPEDLDVFIKDIIDTGISLDKDIKDQFDSFPDDLKMMAKLVGIGMQRYGTGSNKADETKAELEQKIASVEERMKVLESREQSLKAQEDKLAREAWDNEIEQSVPGWRDMINKDKRFPDWFKRQGGWIKDALTKPNEPVVVIEAMQKFVNDVGAATKKMKAEQDIYKGNDTRTPIRNKNRNNTERDDWDAAVDAAANSRSLY